MKIKNDVELVSLPEVGVMPPDANLMIPDPTMLSYYRLAKDRVFFVDFEIDERLMDVIKEIMRINMEDMGVKPEERMPIVIPIMSYGGDLDITFTFIDVCAMSQTPIITINMGSAMSAGILLLLAGHKRYALKHSQAMIHSGSAGMEGTFEQMEASQNFYKAQVSKMREYILERTKIDAKMFGRKKSKDWYLSADDQLNYGIVDAFVDDFDEVF